MGSNEILKCINKGLSLSFSKSTAVTNVNKPLIKASYTVIHHVLFLNITKLLTNERGPLLRHF